MTDTRDARFSFWRGFLVHGLLWGIAIGYVIADLAAETKGLLFLGTPRTKTGIATGCILVFPTIGLILGLWADMLRKYDSHRIEFSEQSTKLLFWCGFIYIVIVIFVNLPRVQ